MFSLRSPFSGLRSHSAPVFQHTAFVRFFQFASLFPFSHAVSINDAAVTIPRSILMAAQSDFADIFKNTNNHFGGGMYANNHGAQIIHGDATGNDAQGHGIAEYKYVVMTDKGTNGLIPCAFLMARILPSIDISDDVHVRIVLAMGLHGRDAEGNAVFKYTDVTCPSDIMQFLAFSNGIMTNILANRPLEVVAINEAAAGMDTLHHQQLFDYVTTHRTYADLLKQAAMFHQASSHDFNPT